MFLDLSSLQNHLDTKTNQFIPINNKIYLAQLVHKASTSVMINYIKNNGMSMPKMRLLASL